MKNYFIFFLFIFTLAMANHAFAQKMNNKQLNKLLLENSDSLNGRLGYWQIFYQGLEMMVITDESHNRMRIIAPIAHTNEIEYTYILDALEANFHTALDVKYAISEDIMWTVFIHPLKELSKEQLTDAIKQVYFGTLNFGGSFSSTNLVFPAK